MATLSKGYVFGSTESVTNAKLHSLVDSATITGIVNADIDAGAAIDFSKIVQENIDGSKLTGLANIVAGAGVIPAANLTSVAQKGANSDITSLAGLTTALSVAQGGTGSTAAKNTAGGVVVPTGAVNEASGAVVLDADSKLPAVDGSQLTGLSAVTQANDTDAGTSFTNGVVTFLTKAKTITSGKTVLLIATGYIACNAAAATTVTLTLKQGSTAVQTLTLLGTAGTKYPWSASGIVTGLSGSITFSVTVYGTTADTQTAYGNLEVIEF